MTSTPDQSVDRRDPMLRDALMVKFQRELQQCPGLALTVEQAARLFDVPRDVCGRLLGVLVQQGALYVRPDGRFVGFPNLR